MSWKKRLCLALCAGLLCWLVACSESVTIRSKGEMVIGGGVESRR